MMQKGYYTILPYHSICHYPHLKLSPAGVVPQRTRRPRPIMDYSFTTVNHHSLPIAPTNSMQMGFALQRILQTIAYANPAFGPPLLCKFDLSDGYYRVPLSPEATLELAVVIPGFARHKSLVALPLCLPMGWKNSPPYFCAFTESIADIANASIQCQTAWPPHPLEGPSQNHSVPKQDFEAQVLHPPSPPLRNPVAMVDIYVDDFIGIAQRPHLHTTLRVTLHAIDSIFHGDPLPTDKPTRKATISASKLAAGDGAWSTRKIVLGWDLNTAAGTIGLPSHKASRLLDLLSHFANLHRTSRRKWQSLLGELRHMATAIQGAKYLFSILQHVLVDQPQGTRLRLSPLVRHSLQDWSTLASSLHNTPTLITTLVPRAPHYVGAVDASRAGIGSFWIPTTYSPDHPPLAFCIPFPPSIANRLITNSNPKGTLNNSEFELAALVLGTAVLAPHVARTPVSVLCGSDNSAAVHWCRQGSTSSKGPTACLLRWLAKLTRDQNIALQPVFVNGTTNLIADFCSRSFALSDQAFLQQLQAKFPTKASWTLVLPTPDTTSLLTSTLSAGRLPWESHTNAPWPLIQLGPSGTISAKHYTWTPPSNTPMIASYPSKSLPFAIDEENCLPAKVRSVAKQWQMPFAPLGRRWPTWDTLIPDCCHLAN
jgi:hypothetical protein